MKGGKCLIITAALFIATSSYVSYGADSGDKDKEVKIRQSAYGYTPKMAKTKTGKSLVQSLMIGPLGIHIDFDESASLMKVREIESAGPANGKLRAGDYLVGVDKSKFPPFPKFKIKKENVTHPRCPAVIMLADAIDKAEGSKSGRLNLVIKRNGKTGKVSIPLKRIGSYSPIYPFKCKKSRIIATRACDHIVKAFKKGAWGKNGFGGGASGYETGLCGLALLAQPDRKKYMPVAHQLADRLLKLTVQQLTRGEYMCNTYVALFLCEYYFITKNTKVKAKLKEIYKRYLDGAQPYGGWGHGYRGGIYGGGGYAISTGHVIMAIGLMSKIIDIDKDRTRHTMAHLCAPFSKGSIGYCGTWGVKDGKENVTPENLSRGGEGVSRTGTSVLGMGLLGYDPHNIKPAMVAYLSDPITYIAYYMPHCCHVIGQFPCTVAVARENPRAFRAHMDSEKWWYTLGRRYDGELILGPIVKRLELRNDFQKKYGLMAANGCVALIHSIDQRKLYMFRTVKPFTKLNNMAVYRKWNNWLLSRKGSEPKRPCAEEGFSKPKNFPQKVPTQDYRTANTFEFNNNDRVEFDAEIVSPDWRQLLLVRDKASGSLYWTVIQRGDDDCAWYRNGKMILDHGKFAADGTSKSKKKEAEKCLTECKNVKVTLRAKACTNKGGGWIKVHKLDFYN